MNWFSRATIQVGKKSGKRNYGAVHPRKGARKLGAGIYSADDGTSSRNRLSRLTVILNEAKRSEDRFLSARFLRRESLLGLSPSGQEIAFENLSNQCLGAASTLARKDRPSRREE